MFKLQSISIKNFKSIAEATLEVRDGLWVVEGINNDDKKLLHNGVGKTSLVCDSLLWGLYGKVSRDDYAADDVVNLDAGKNCEVIVEFETDGGSVRVRRTRKHQKDDNSLQLWLNDQNVSLHKVADTQAEIERLLKVPFSIFRSTIVISSDIKNGFTKLTPQGKVELLESIRDYAIWDKIRDDVNAECKVINTAINNNDKEIASLKGSSDAVQRIIDDLNGKITKAIETFDRPSIEKRIADSKQAVETLTTTKKACLESRTNSTERERLITEQTAITDKSLAIKTQISDIQLAITKDKSAIATNEKWLSELKCPTCGASLNKTDADIRDKTSTNEALREGIALKEKQIAELEKTVEANRTAYAELKDKVGALDKQAYDAQRHIDELDSKIRAEDGNITQLTAFLNNHESQIAGWRQQIADYEKTIAANTEKVAQIEQDNKKLANDRFLAEFYYKLLGPKGTLRPYLLRRDIDYINQRLKLYIAEFFDDATAMLTQPDLASNDIKVVFTDNGMVKPIHLLSGGEEKRLNVAVQLAIYDLIKSTSNFDFNIWIVDEIEAQTDEYGVQALVKIITERSEYIPSVYWISNNPDVLKSIQTKLIVTKTESRTNADYNA